MTAKRSTNKDKDNLCLPAQHWIKDDIKKVGDRLEEFTEKCRYQNN